MKHLRPQPLILCLAFGVTWLGAAAVGLSQLATTPTQARETLHRVIDFYRTEVGHRGAYLYRYSADLKFQEGESIATKTSGWVQPPGTPAVGEAYLNAWRLSGDAKCLEAAVEAAHALVDSQLMSGGWSSHFDLGAEGGRKYAYRVRGEQSAGNNLTTFDDDKTQSALTFLMHIDEALGFADADIHAAVDFALPKILAAQYPNGAWPQQYTTAANANDYPVKPASYPRDWSRTYPAKKYLEFYTLNDGNMSHIIDMLFEAQRIYGRDDCYAAAVKTGEFFLLAQMPQPQPGWAQQYDVDMHPAWARKFEPPAITGGESQGVLRSLMTLYRFTGEQRFLEPIPPALEYFRASLLADGQLARFYELQTNQPLYFTKVYELTYDDSDMPTHYGFKVGSRLDAIDQAYQQLLNLDAKQLKPVQRVTQRLKMSSRLAQRAEQVAQQLDHRGAWVEVGRMLHTSQELPVIEMRTFIRNLQDLAASAGMLE